MKVTEMCVPELPEGIMCRIIMGRGYDPGWVSSFLVAMSWRFDREAWLSAGPQGAD